MYGNDACFSSSAIIIFCLSIGWEIWPPPAQTLLSTFQWLNESLDPQIQGKKKTFLVQGLNGPAWVSGPPWSNCPAPGLGPLGGT